MLLSEGQMSDYKGAALMIDAFPKAAALLGDKGYDADWFRTALADRGIAACIPSKANRKTPRPYDHWRYRERHLVECFMNKIKHFRRVFSRSDKLAKRFLGFLSFVASLIWLR